MRLCIALRHIKFVVKKRVRNHAVKRLLWRGFIKKTNLPIFYFFGLQGASQTRLKKLKSKAFSV
jgi:hypothetical protein